MNKLSRANIFALVGLSILCWFFCIYRLGATSISATSDEIIHIRVVQEMLQSGDMLHPSYGGEPYFNKPPLKMWLSLVPLALLGESNFSYRVLDGLSGIGILCLVFVFARRYFASELGGLLAALTLCGARVFVLGAHGIRHATQDAFMLLLTTVAMVAGLEIVRGYRGDGEVKPGPHVVFCVATGLAVFTKSVGGIVPLGVFALYLLTDRESLRAALGKWRWWLLYGVLGFAPVILFYGYHLWLNAPALINSFRLEVVERALVGYHNRSRQLFYWRALFLRNEIGTPALLAAGLLGAAVSSRIDYRYRYLLLWALAPICLYSLSKSKLPWYIFVSYPALALCIGFIPLYVAALPQLRRLLAVVVLTLIGVLSFRAYRVGTHVMLTKRIAIDRAVEQVQQSAEPLTAVVGDPLRLSAKPRKYRRRLEFIYLSMLRPRTIAPEAIKAESAKNFFCLAEGCSAVELERGAPVEKVMLPPLRPRRKSMYLLRYD